MQTTCKQCGECCEKSTPALHIEDKYLVNKGAIPLKDLFTMRKGEMAMNNVTGKLAPIDSEIIKIKGQNSTWACQYLDMETKKCAIYASRPAECRLLKCWDNKALARMYDKNRLTRKDLVGEIEGLWDLISDHEEKCNYANIGVHAAKLETDEHDNAMKALNEIILYDINIREILAAKGKMNPEMLDFILGRPLSKTIIMFDLKIEKKDGGYVLIPVKKTS